MASPYISLFDDLGFAPGVSAPSSGQALVWDGTKWVPGTVGGSQDIAAVLGVGNDAGAHDLLNLANLHATNLYGDGTNITGISHSQISGLGTSATHASTDYLSAVATQAAHAFAAGPTSGSPAAPTWRAITAADVPTLAQLAAANGDFGAAALTLNGETITDWPVAPTFPGASGDVLLSDGTGGATVGSVPMTVDTTTGRAIVGGGLTTTGGSTVLSTLPPFGTSILGQVNYNNAWVGSGFLFTNANSGTHAFSLVYNIDTAFFGAADIPTAWMTVSAAGGSYNGSGRISIGELFVGSISSFGDTISLNSHPMNLGVATVQDDGTGNVTATGSWNFGRNISFGNPYSVFAETTLDFGGSCSIQSGSGAVSINAATEIDFNAPVKMTGHNLSMNFGTGSGGGTLNMDGGNITNPGSASLANMLAGAGITPIADGTYAISTSLGGSVTFQNGTCTAWTPAA